MSVHADPPPAIVSEPHGINYATSNQLGKGGFAICFKAERLDQDRPTGHLVALKIVKTKMEPAKLAQKFVTELQIHSKLSHPNIVTFHRAFSFGPSTYVVLELCSNGSLADMLKKRKHLTMPEIRRFTIQVAGAVKYLHARNIVHRDLKTGNLFLDEHMNIKVGDFGLAALLVSGKDMDAKRRTTMCGTPNYLAPEILEKGKGHSEKVDLWAIGIIAYTLAVGKAPFHASSKEEIYKKLKAGDYSWPELSSITNEISADLRDLVSKLLVAEELRPGPDSIVAHPFFKIAFVPRQMSRAQLTKAPVWPEVQIPSAEILQRGYSDSWWIVCKESGVGEYAPGKCFQLTSGKRIRSIVRDIEKEVAAGRQPVLPIPSDVVYTPFPSSNVSWASHMADALPDIAEESEGRLLKEIPNNEVQQPFAVPARQSSLESDVKRRKDAELMPPPVRARRLGTARRTRAAPEDEMPREAYGQEVAPFPTRAESRLPASQGTAGTPPSDTGALDTAAPPKRSVDASLARRPRATRKTQLERESAMPSAAPETTVAAKASSTTLRASATRGRQSPPDVIEIFDDEVNSDKALHMPPPPVMKAKLPVPKRERVLSSMAAPGTDPETVLERLSAFRDNLASALQHKHTAPSRRLQQQPSKPLPFVSRWVDYSKKHGVGYVLSDGTVGCIVNASVSKGTPVTHVTVRNGVRWLNRVGKRFENLDRVPFRILEDHGAAGIEQIQTTACDEQEKERLRMLRILWAKFGRYMSQSLNGDDDDDLEADSDDDMRDLSFVRFYQRIGIVGIWGFSDGCVQLHFPDHTKFVLSADGVHLSATLVPVEGIVAIQETNDIPSRLLRDREVLAHNVHALLYGSRPGRAQKPFAEQINANMVEDKLGFLLQVIDQWIEGGGLGCARSEEKLEWQGLWVSENARKIDWVTVGRYGGDEAKA